jgi:hypothetical protein
MRPSIVIFSALYVVGCGWLQVAAAGPPAPVQPAAGQDSAKISAAADAGPTASALPSSPTAAPPMASASPPSDPTTAPPIASASPPSDASASPAVTDALIKKFRSKGYKPVVHEGTTVFCRREATLGSRLETQVCRTAQQLDEAAQQGQDMGRDIQRGGNLGIRDTGR